ncbi:hypothetical protein GOP47_0022240 [Adiantum capillus-veneris]|uniref:Uncharacterized protein n=1 Tax=Adiantum capillus-veneris TaxID=13818 RepID=A0A9D4U9X7_ADICA|nr:hypothetical protein GOP47_0022240 [Adiantum capillus-veneris]
MGEQDAIKHRSYARVGLLGNPSDAYFGRTISFGLANYWAEVTLTPSPSLVIQPHPIHDPHCFSSLPQLVKRVQDEGYYGGVRLLLALCKKFYEYCSSHDISLHSDNFTLSYDTNIPRQAGLSGSSAIVCAALNCMLEFYNINNMVKVQERPTLILSAEEEIGIVAGLQDRVVQVYGGLVYMDFDKHVMERTGHGLYTPMDVSLLPVLYLIHTANPSDSGKVHSTVRRRWVDGDKSIRHCMEQVAELALQGRSVLQNHDCQELARLMNLNFDLRRQMFGDDVLGAINIRMVEVARSVGAACKFTGSGGAVIAFCPDGPDQVKRLEEACRVAEFTMEKALVAPAFFEPSS